MKINKRLEKAYIDECSPPGGEGSGQLVYLQSISRGCPSEGQNKSTGHGDGRHFSIRTAV